MNWIGVGGRATKKGGKWGGVTVLSPNFHTAGNILNFIWDDARGTREERRKVSRFARGIQRESARFRLV
jgi:hypothetical protein